MDIKGLLNAAVDVAEKAGPLLGDKGAAAAGALDAIRDLVNRATVVATETDQPALQDRLAKAMTRMNEHADKTINSLG